MADLTFIISVLQFWQREHSLATAHGLAGNLLAVAMLPLLGAWGLSLLHLPKRAILLEYIIRGKRLATNLCTPATKFDLPSSEESVILMETTKFPQ